MSKCSGFWEAISRETKHLNDCSKLKAALNEHLSHALSCIMLCFLFALLDLITNELAVDNWAAQSNPLQYAVFEITYMQDLHAGHLLRGSWGI